ncbi:hypothetical protein [Cryobacterium psychrophilum]|uniref:Uncharacterized protein n=1 Tax=Cryobacterium psychrophilum TaxID=41988 RepID=A0A4Y8KQL6_9MICO|nr:hypothetical protein [Cryobacterium psychrophilum]TDW29802.1 hypothetical protein EDD25_1515 [Cryobacterium psychrophilum]TFD80183.1 hypothetical protein E3T53_05890 [Cryobacterium psychrophilum]
MPQNHTPKAFNTPLKKKLFGGAVTVMTAGSLLGLGAVGAQAVPADEATDASTKTSASAEGSASNTDDVIAAVKHQLRADIRSGDSVGEKAQNVSITLESHAELFASLPANLQADLTELNAASDDERDALAAQIGTTALDGGYGEEAQKVATAVQDNPKHPLAAAMRALVSLDAGEAEEGRGGRAEATAERITGALLSNPGLFANLPTELQNDLTALKDAPAGDRSAAADAIEANGLAGEYGAEIQKIAEHLQANGAANADAPMHAEAKADADR